MAIIQIILDDSGNVVGVNRVPVDPSSKGLFSVTGAYSYGTTYGAYKQVVDASYGRLIEQSTVLTAQEKVSARVAVSGREIGDTVAFASVGTAAGTPVVTASALNGVMLPPVTDSVGTVSKIIVRFVDP